MIYFVVIIFGYISMYVMMYYNIYIFVTYLQCEKCWSGSGKLQGHTGRHCFETPQARSKRKNKRRKGNRTGKLVCM